MQRLSYLVVVIIEGRPNDHTLIVARAAERDKAIRLARDTRARIDRTALAEIRHEGGITFVDRARIRLVGTQVPPIPPSRP